MTAEVCHQSVAARPEGLGQKSTHSKEAWHYSFGLRCAKQGIHPSAVFYQTVDSLSDRRDFAAVHLYPSFRNSPQSLAARAV